MSSIGLPSLNGFVGEFLILLGTFQVDRWAAVVAASGVVLAAAYMLWMYRRVMFGEVVHPENRGLIDLDWRERMVMVAMIIPIVWIGIQPGPMLQRIEPAVADVLDTMAERGAVLPGRAPEAPEPETPEGVPAPEAAWLGTPGARAEGG
jgi:NADH-quinone oxidoreductase subunit M